MRRVSLGLIVLLTLGWFALATAQWPSDPAINVPICTAPGQQMWIDMIADGSGGAIMAWHDPRHGTPLRIYAQRVDASGFLKWAVDGIRVCPVDSGQALPKLASDGSGGAIITWVDGRGDSNSIYAQRIDPSGAPVWASDGAPVCTSATMKRWPINISDGSGGAVISWNSRLTHSTEDVRIQRIDAYGVPIWDPDGVLVSSGNVTHQHNRPWIASDCAGGAIVTWNQGLSGTDTVFVQRIDESGQILWAQGGVPVCTDSSRQSNQDILSDGMGGAVVFWCMNGHLYGQRIDPDGSLLWLPEGILLSNVGGRVSYYDFVPDGSGGAIYAWADPERGILARRVDGSGALQWQPGGAQVFIGPLEPYLAPDHSGGALIVWRDAREDTIGRYNSNVYAQRVDGSGTVLWDEDGIPVSTEIHMQTTPAIVSGSSGMGIVVWYDDRNEGWDTWDFYAQNINPDGTLGIPQPVHTTGGGWIAERAEGREEKRTFGFNAHSELGVVWGQLQLTDHATKMKIHSDTVATLTITGDTCAEFSGTCRVGRNHGYTFDCAVEDRDEPGCGKDRFSLDVWDPDGNPYYSARGVLGGGNIQIHTSEDEALSNLGHASEGISEPEPEHSGSIQPAGTATGNRFSLAQSSPNLFCTKTTISYSIPRTSHVRLGIFDHAGRLVATLVDSEVGAGLHTAAWHTESAPSGIYFCRLQVGPEGNRRAGDFTDVMKMVVLR